jgi:hypothetical protein
MMKLKGRPIVRAKVWSFLNARLLPVVPSPMISFAHLPPTALPLLLLPAGTPPRSPPTYRPWPRRHPAAPPPTAGHLPPPTLSTSVSDKSLKS